MVRIIDSDAINKRVFADIANTFKHSSKITGEKTVQDFSGTDDPRAAAVDNFNFNGIEFSKIKQMINYIQTHKKEFKFDRVLAKITYSKEELLSQYYDSNLTIESITSKQGVLGHAPNGSGKHEILVDDKFDGRNSFIYPRVVIAYESGYVAELIIREEEGWTFDENAEVEVVKKVFLNTLKSNIEKRTMSQNESFYFGQSKQSDIHNINSFASISAGSTRSQLIVDKAKQKITISYDLPLAPYACGVDFGWAFYIHTVNNPTTELFDRIKNAYLDILCVYWRDK